MCVCVCVCTSHGVCVLRFWAVPGREMSFRFGSTAASVACASRGKCTGRGVTLEMRRCLTFEGAFGKSDSLPSEVEGATYCRVMQGAAVCSPVSPKLSADSTVTDRIDTMPVVFQKGNVP